MAKLLPGIQQRNHFTQFNSDLNFTFRQTFYPRKSAVFHGLKSAGNTFETISRRLTLILIADSGKFFIPINQRFFNLRKSVRNIFRISPR
jgi:hypothetical protein